MKRILLSAILVMFIAGCTTKTTGTFYLTVSQVSANSDKYLNHEVRVVGDILEGTLTWIPKTLKFTLSDGKSSLNVTYKGDLPVDIGEGKRVVVTGILDSKTHVTASQILVKCPTKYEKKNLTG
ncbi:MAG: cytochrome c maturation protein CcmE [Candidatus Hydrothermarchaeota archaeon]